jgi:hypothetical protein
MMSNEHLTRNSSPSAASQPLMLRAGNESARGKPTRRQRLNDVRVVPERHGPAVIDKARRGGQQQRRGRARSTVTSPSCQLPAASSCNRRGTWSIMRVSPSMGAMVQTARDSGERHAWS